MRPSIAHLRPLLAVTLTAALALLAGGCGDTVVDQAKLEETSQASLEKSLHEKISAVDCPSGEKVEPGSTFSCEVIFPHGVTKIVTFKIRNTDADLTTLGLKAKE